MRAAYLVAILITIGLFVAGAAMALFGPSSGRLLGIPAFLATAALFVIIGEKQRRGTLRSLMADQTQLPEVNRVLFIVRAICMGLFVITLAIALLAPGVHDGRIPVFDVQPPYQLNNHGRMTTVGRSYYVIVGASFTIGWHALGIFFATLPLEALLFGNMSLIGRKSSN